MAPRQRKKRTIIWDKTLVESQFFLYLWHDVVTVLRIEDSSGACVEDIGVTAFGSHIRDGLFGTVDNGLQEVLLALLELFLCILLELLDTDTHILDFTLFGIAN